MSYKRRKKPQEILHYGQIRTHKPTKEDYWKKQYNKMLDDFMRQNKPAKRKVKKKRS